MDRGTDGHTDKWMEKHIDRQTNKQTDKQMHGWTTDREGTSVNEMPVFTIITKEQEMVVCSEQKVIP